MCGIAGFISTRRSSEDRRAAVEAMVAAQLHRGPDDGGLMSEGDATLGMRRLAIFDPANGQQPMSTPDGRHTIVFNGAIYNFRELASELATLGWRFRTQSDTEVLLAACGQWGEACLPKLRGMFAFAVWDRIERRLFAARDSFGIKPLYYWQEPEGDLLFASEIRSLLASGRIDAGIDPEAIEDYLAWLAVPAPRTLYKGVRSLRPGEYAIWKDGRLAIQAHWTFANAGRNAPVSSTRADFVANLRLRLEDTIRAHSAADVPVGAFLSGGLDSTAVAALMARSTGNRLKTFSIGFPEADFSEAEAAADNARHLGADHHAIELTGAQVAGDLDRIFAALDQPTGDGINTYYVSQAARAGGVKVALSGLGGDELFGGYPSFRNLPRLAGWIAWWRRLPRPVRRLIVDRLPVHDARRRKLADFLRYGRNLPELAALQRRVFDETTRRAILASTTASRGRSPSPYHPELRALHAELAGAGPGETISAWELRTYMADVLLRDSDVMSMAHSLELRVPFIDRTFIEWLWAQPAAFKFDAGQPKSALAEAVRDLMPPSMARRQKRGFTLPFPIWMKGELKPFLDETFSGANAARSGLFAPAQVRGLWTGFLKSDDSRQWSRIWSLAVLIHYSNQRLPRVCAGLRSIEIASHSSPDASRRDEPAAGPAKADDLRPPAFARPSAGRPPSLTGRSLLMAPEIFASEGGIPRILQMYLKALCDLSEHGPADVRLLALNDPMMDSGDIRRCAGGSLDNWYVCTRHKGRFIKAALRLSQGCERAICGHVAQLPVAWLARRLNPRLKYYLVAHGIEVWRPFGPAEKLALRGAARIFCVSDFTRRELLRHCPLPEGRAVVLPNALDPTFEISPGIPLAQCPPIVLCVTRLTFADRYKGVEDLVAAMPEIRRRIPAARLRIVGRGDDLPRLQKLARSLQVADAVDFLGYVPDAALTDEIRRCRLFALPSRKEGFGLVFLEAMARGRPCLGARAGGIPEVIDERTGVLVDHGDIPGIAAAATEALQRDWSEEDILARARHFSYEPFRERLGEILNA